MFSRLYVNLVMTHFHQRIVSSVPLLILDILHVNAESSKNLYFPSVQRILEFIEQSPGKYTVYIHTTKHFMSTNFPLQVYEACFALKFAIFEPTHRLINPMERFESRFFKTYNILLFKENNFVQLGVTKNFASFTTTIYFLFCYDNDNLMYYPLDFLSLATKQLVRNSPSKTDTCWSPSCNKYCSKLMLKMESVQGLSEHIGISRSQLQAPVSGWKRTESAQCWWIWEHEIFCCLSR